MPPASCLDKNAIINAQKLARSNHVLLCLDEHCPRRKEDKIHTGGGRAYYGKFHVNEKDMVQLPLSFS